MVLVFRVSVSLTTGELSSGVLFGSDAVQPESRIQLQKISIKLENNLFIGHILPKTDNCFENSKFKKYLKFKYIKQPQVSVIVPLFNCEKTIASSLNSIQFQNITKIEIILINDFSTDNTSEIIKKFKEKDHRIIIIENHKNMGALYSRSIASLISKGYYINHIVILF